MLNLAWYAKLSGLHLESSATLIRVKAQSIETSLAALYCLIHEAFSHPTYSACFVFSSVQRTSMIYHDNDLLNQHSRTAGCVPSLSDG